MPERSQQLSAALKCDCRIGLIEAEHWVRFAASRLVHHHSGFCVFIPNPENLSFAVTVGDDPLLQRDE